MRVHVSVRASGKPNYKGLKIPVSSGLKLEEWSNLLVSYRDKIIVQYLMYGWPIGAYSNVPSSNAVPRNHAGARDFPQDVLRYLHKEVSLGASLGPFAINPMPGKAHLSPLNSVPKKGSQTRRIIVDLSFPPGRSVNDAIHKNFYEGEFLSLQYPSVDDLSALIVQFGQGCSTSEIFAEPTDSYQCAQETTITWDSHTTVNTSLIEFSHSASDQPPWFARESPRP